MGSGLLGSNFCLSRVDLLLELFVVGLRQGDLAMLGDSSLHLVAHLHDLHRNNGLDDL